MIATGLGIGAAARRLGATPGAAAEWGALAGLLSVLFWLEIFAGDGWRGAALAIWPAFAIGAVVVWRRRRAAGPAATQDLSP